MSDEDDEMWDDEPAESYDAMLVDVQDPRVSYGNKVIEASNDEEAITKALQWALEIGKKGTLILKQGIRGVHSQEI